MVERELELTKLSINPTRSGLEYQTQIRIQAIYLSDENTVRFLYRIKLENISGSRGLGLML